MNRRDLIRAGLSLPLAFFAPSANWRDNYRYMTIEIKFWMDIDGKSGYETKPLVSIDGGPFDWIFEPLRLDNSAPWAFTPPQYVQGKTFKFWQSEKTSMMIKDLTLKLKERFESDTWWANYS